MTVETPRVGLFVTCLVDAIRPRIGFAAIRLLEEAGCTVEVPLTQTCCGQPAYNSGDTGSAAAIARQVIASFEPYDHVVVPSGSCAGMIRCHYPEALADDLARWLNGEPTRARPVWRLWRWATASWVRVAMWLLYTLDTAEPMMATPSAPPT